MGKQIVFVEDRFIKLDTSLTPQAFARSKSADRLAEKGRLARKTSDGWVFEPWAFTDTSVKVHTNIVSGIERKANETVILQAMGFSGSTLKNLFEKEASKNISEGEHSHIQLAGATVCAAMEAASRQKEPVENIGAGGIVVSDDCSQVLFVPLVHIESAASCMGEKEYSEHQGFYINPTLTGNAAIHYTQSVIAYRLLTGTLPFNETNPDKRHLDIIDANYTPLASSVWALDETLASFVDNSLQRKALIRSKKTGKKLAPSLADKITSIIEEKEKDDKDDNTKRTELGLVFPLEPLYRELGLTENGEIPATGKLNSVIRKSNIPQELFEKNNRKRENIFKKKLAVKRWLRKAKIPLLISAGVTVIISALWISIAKSHSENPTSRGLSASQTIEMFYSGMNTQDSLAMHECSSCTKASELENMVSTMYVTGKTLAAYDATKKLVSPAEWMNFNYDGSYMIFGLADFSIRTNKGSIFFNAPAINTKPKPITEEEGKPVKNGDKINMPVSYTLLYTEGDSTNSIVLKAVYHNDSIALEFKKDRWIITDIQENASTPVSIDYQTFLKDYQNTFKGKDIDKDPIVTANELRSKYPWIPTNSEILEAQQKMIQESLYTQF
ncbi:MAG: hypothetical protein J5857_08435 [Treponema sp.]|nr:hypothetical protein [Treponema sp.]